MPELRPLAILQAKVSQVKTELSNSWIIAYWEDLMNESMEPLDSSPWKSLHNASPADVICALTKEIIQDNSTAFPYLWLIVCLTGIYWAGVVFYHGN